MRKRALVAIASVVLLLGVACGGDDGDGGGSDSGGGTVTLTASNFSFDPSDLSAAAGDSIEFTNEDDAEHSFTSDDAGIDQDVEAGGSTTIDLSDVEPGTYDFICKYHPDQMKGTLEVTE